MKINRNLVLLVLLWLVVIGLFTISVLLLTKSLTDYQHIQVVFMGLGLFFGWLASYMGAQGLKLGRIEIDKVRHVLRAYSLFGTFRAEIRKDEVKRFAIRDAQTKYGSFRELIVLTEDEFYLIPLLGMDRHINSIHRFFRKHQHDLRVAKMGAYRDFRSFGWILLTIGSFVTSMTLLSLMGSKALENQRLEPENLEYFTVNVDRYQLSYNKEDRVTSVDIRDYAKPDFDFKLSAPSFSTSALYRVIEELDKGYLTVKVQANKELYEEKILGIEHPTNFNERHFNYGEITVHRIEVGQVTQGDIAALSLQGQGGFSVWFSVFGLLLTLGGLFLIRSFRGAIAFDRLKDM